MRDPNIRQILRETELLKYLKDSYSRVVEEFTLPVAKARIDIAVINGHLHGYEIKSAVDTLQRLPTQIEAYTKVFDYLSIVTEEKHFGRVLNVLPEWVGLIVCSEDGLVRQVREATFNHRKEPFYLAKLLWREEVVDILEGMRVKYRKKDRSWLLCELLASSIDTDLLSDLVRAKLKNRSCWKENQLQ